MPVALAFALTSAVALVLLSVFLVRVEIRRQVYVASGRNGDGRRVGTFLVRLVMVRTLNALCLFLAAIGAFTSARSLLYLIALIPLTYIVATIFDLRDL